MICYDMVGTIGFGLILLVWLSESSFWLCSGSVRFEFADLSAEVCFGIDILLDGTRQTVLYMLFTIWIWPNPIAACGLLRMPL